MANDRFHRYIQAEKRLRQATAVKGNTEFGCQSIHGEPGTSSVESISLVLRKVGNSFSSRNANLVDGWKLIVIPSDEAANQFRA
jgi:hypothetical protein